jgi:hypothetical protein
MKEVQCASDAYDPREPRDATGTFRHQNAQSDRELQIARLHALDCSKMNDLSAKDHLGRIAGQTLGQHVDDCRISGPGSYRRMEMD